MKKNKLNLLIIFISIIGTIISIILKKQELILVLKDLSIIITINLIYIINKLFNTKINEKINTIYIIFIFLAHFLGVILQFYDKIYWFDKFVHWLSGCLTTMVAIISINKIKLNKKILFNILFSISFTMLIASMWEMFEYLSSVFFDVDPQKTILTGVNDTMCDIIVAYLGSILVSLLYYFEIKYNKNIIINKLIKKA